MNHSYVALDLETTGLNPKLEKIIEVGALRVEDGRETGRLSVFVNPGRFLEPRITELTGITDEMLSGAPLMGDVIGEIMEFMGDLPLLGHRILFDYSFLKRAAVNAGYSFEREGIDTLTLCRRFMPADEKKNLGNACRFFHIETGTAHRALSDAAAAHGLFLRLFQEFGAGDEGAFLPKPLIYKAKREQPATKRQKEHLHDLAKYHRINLSVQIDTLTRSEVSRCIDQIITQYGKIQSR